MDNKNAKADAALYLLTMLFQRLEDERPGLISELEAGIMSDQAATPTDLDDGIHIEKVFSESLHLLKRARQG